MTAAQWAAMTPEQQAAYWRSGNSGKRTTRPRCGPEHWGWGLKEGPHRVVVWRSYQPHPSL